MSAPSSPVPLLLCPGLLNDAALWAPVCARLGAAVIPHCADMTAASSPEELADAVLAQAPPRFALAGLSMGGYLAFEIWRRAPQRVMRLAILSSSARPDLPEQRQRRLDMIRIAERGGFDRLLPQIFAGQLHPDHLQDPAIRPVLEEMAGRIGPQGFIRQQNLILQRPDSRPTLAGITVPALVIGGQDDGLTTAEIVGEIAAGLPAARLHLLPRCGHLAPLEQPEAVATLLLDWLQQGSDQSV